jgi:hypothetical protein
VSFGGLFQNQFNVWWAIMKWPKVVCIQRKKHVLRQRLSYRFCSALILGAIILEGSTVRLMSYCSSVEGLVPVF